MDFVVSGFYLLCFANAAIVMTKGNLSGFITSVRRERAFRSYIEYFDCQYF